MTTCFEMLEHPDEDGSDYKDSDEGLDEGSDESSDVDTEEEWDGLPLDVLLSRLEDSDEFMRVKALETLAYLDPATLAQVSDEIVARLEDSDPLVRATALETMTHLDPVTLAQYADPVAARLEDSDSDVRRQALETLDELEPATLAQYADAVVARLEDSDVWVRMGALWTMGELEPATLAQHAIAVIARLEDSHSDVREEVLTALHALPLVVTRDVDLESSDVRSRLLGRLAWYNYRLRVRAKRIALYWYALPYRPSGPGHARDVEAWGRMVEE